MEQESYTQLMTEIKALQDKNVFLENQILFLNQQIVHPNKKIKKPKNIPFSLDDFSQNPTVEYLESHNLDYEARRSLFYDSDEYLSTSCIKYLVDYHLQHKMSLYENPCVMSYVFEHGTSESIKYTMSIAISNNLLDIEYFDKHGFIFQIIRRGCKDLVEYFTNFYIENGFSLNKSDPDSISYMTVFDAICKYCDLDTIKCFVDICLRNGINIEKMDNGTNSLRPINIICTKAHPENHFQTFKYLIDLYVDQGYNLWNDESGYKYSIVQQVLCCDDTRYEHYLIDVFEKHNLLLEYKSCNGRTLLHEICRFATRTKVVRRVVEIWVKNNYGLEIRDDDGNTLLHYVCVYNCTHKRFKYVIDTWVFHGLDIECKNHLGVVPIDWLSPHQSRVYFLKIYKNKYGMEKITRMLLKYKIGLFEYLTLACVDENVVEQIMRERSTECVSAYYGDGDGECSLFLNGKKYM